MKGHGIVRDLEYITFSIAGLAGTGGAQRGQRLHLGRGALTDQLLELWVEGALGHGVDARVCGGARGLAKNDLVVLFGERTVAELCRVLVILLVRFVAGASLLHGLHVAFGVGAGGEGEGKGEADEHHCASFVLVARRD